MRTLLRTLTILALIISAGICVFLGRNGVESDVYALVGDDADAVSSLARKTASIYRVVCDEPELYDECRALAEFDPPIDPKVMYETIRTHGKGLLSERSCELLRANETNRIARSAMRRDYSGIGIFPKADDPFYFLHDFVVDFKALQPKGEILVGSRSPVGGLIELARKNPKVHLSGSPFHTYIATESSRREINLLGIISLIAVFALGFALFRTLRFAFPMVLAIGVGFLVGTAALLILPGRPHMLTFLFGTSLIGLGVDYCYHSFHGCSRSSLAGALITTSFAFSPLVFSSVRVLREMAVFTIAGLCAIYVFVLCAFKPLDEVKTKLELSDKFMRRLRVAKWIVGFFAVLGLFRLDFGNDISQFHRMDPMMEAGERAVAEASGTDKIKFSLVDLEKWQQENAALKSKMGMEPSGEFLTAKDLPDWLTLEKDGRTMLVLPSESGVDLKSRLSSMFDRFANEALVMLGVAFAALFAILAFATRRRFLEYASPTFFAVLATAGTLGWLGETINFFHLICFFVLVGLGIDYTIFHKSEDAASASARVVLYSFLTSLVGFGMLAFTSFSVTRSMGITLALGLFFAYVFSIGTSREAKHTVWHEQKEQSAGKLRILFMWHVYRLFGKSIAKLVAFIVVIFVYPFAKSARKAVAEFRSKTLLEASAFKTVLNFAWSMLDKTDACTLAKNLPKISVKGDKGWMQGGAFLISTHLGSIETLPALRKGNRIKVHAFQQMGHDAVFTKMFVRYLDPNQLTLHAVEDIGVETAVEMKAAIERSELVLMAGDRVSAGSSAILRHEFFGHECSWPKGVFRFAKLMEAPVYAITCVSVGWNAYEVKAKKLGDDLLGDYVRFLEGEVRAHPEQWYQFYSFFVQ